MTITGLHFLGAVLLLAALFLLHDWWERRQWERRSHRLIQRNLHRIP